MSWTPASFRARFPEFTALSDAQIQLALNEGVNHNDPRVFQQTIDDAVGYYAADALALSPGGQNARLQKNDIKTTYRAQWERLAQQAAGGPWAIGQGPSGPVLGTWP